jgi:hypothetical protein
MPHSTDAKPPTYDPKQNPLSLEDRRRLHAVRDLYNYKIHYNNPRFPLLSLAYAMYAGGEHTLYCDFTEDFIYEYLLKPLGVPRPDYDQKGSGVREKLPPHVRPVWDALGAIYVRSKQGTVRTEATEAEVKALTDAIHYELVKDSGPGPKW